MYGMNKGLPSPNVRISNIHKDKFVCLFPAFDFLIGYLQYITMIADADIKSRHTLFWYGYRAFNFLTTCW